MVDETEEKSPPEWAKKIAWKIVEPLMYQRPCTGDDIENPDLVLWRRDVDGLVDSYARRLEEERQKADEWKEKAEFFMTQYQDKVGINQLIEIQTILVRDRDAALTKLATVEQTLFEAQQALIREGTERDDARKGWYDADLQRDAALTEAKALREALTTVMDELMDKGEVSAEAQDNALVALAALDAKEPT